MRCKADRVVGCHVRMQVFLYVLTVNSERTMILRLSSGRKETTLAKISVVTPPVLNYLDPISR